ncbi:MDR family oxidoreductase [Rhizobium sp. BK251]|uniref:MDR family oxidoreductase n=1 Tax=Rhizobium sp. BK251 TaxID=2512125 RepID=UPI001044F8B9|nr:acrylyl-CoA reductase (NADPH) [Rhizobium sp. BK251]
MPFNALLATRSDQRAITTRVVSFEESQLMPGEVTVAVEWSSVSYRDALAITGAAPLIKTFPLIPGIDLAGTVEASLDARFERGDKVVLNGWALGQTHHGGYAQRARVSADWLLKLPASISTRDAMAIGTAGYTAMLSVLALEHGGLTPERGDVLVTGASGGVGSSAVSILSKLGYRVIASTGRQEQHSRLRVLGATEIIGRNIQSGEARSIGAARWMGAVDTVGSKTLAGILAQTGYGGVVAACGVVQGADLPASVLPFMQRAVTLIGIDSVNAPRAIRSRAWERLATDLDRATLAPVINEIGLADVPSTASAILQGKMRGRTIVNVNSGLRAVDVRQRRICGSADAMPPSPVGDVEDAVVSTGGSRPEISDPFGLSTGGFVAQLIRHQSPHLAPLCFSAGIDLLDISDPSASRGVF